MTNKHKLPQIENRSARSVFWNPKRNQWLRNRWLTAVIAVPLILGAGNSNSNMRDVNRKRIERMTVAQRDQLDHNFDVYRRLSRTAPKTLADYRDIQIAIENDEELKTVAVAYYAWLKTLSLSQRQRLEDEKDAIQRIELISEIKAERAKQAEEETRDSLPERAVPALVRKQFPRQDRLSDQDLAAVMKIAEENLALQPVQREGLERMDGVRRYAEVFRIIVKQSSDSKPLRSVWLDTELIDEMVSAISNEAQRTRLRKLGLPRQMQQFLIRMVLRSVIVQLQEDARQNPPSQADLKRLFFGLDDQQRDRIMQMPKDQQRMSLRRMYYEMKYPMRELASIMQKFIPRDARMRNDGNQRYPGNRSRPFGPQGRPGNKRNADPGGFDE